MLDLILVDVNNRNAIDEIATAAQRSFLMIGEKDRNRFMRSVFHFCEVTLIVKADKFLQHYALLEMARAGK